MRELKFRAWVDEFNYYAYDIQERADMFEWFGNPTIHIEQSTGLKDKNGKEIYEGDIVKFDNYGDEEISEVYFNGACAGSCTHIVDDHDGDYLPFTRGRDVEVIGNIHESEE